MNNNEQMREFFDNCMDKLEGECKPIGLIYLGEDDIIRTFISGQVDPDRFDGLIVKMAAMVQSGKN